MGLSLIILGPLSCDPDPPIGCLLWVRPSVELRRDDRPYRTRGIKLRWDELTMMKGRAELVTLKGRAELVVMKGRAEHVEGTSWAGHDEGTNWAGHAEGTSWAGHAEGWSSRDLNTQVELDLLNNQCIVNSMWYSPLYQSRKLKLLLSFSNQHQTSNPNNPSPMNSENPFGYPLNPQKFPTLTLKMNQILACKLKTLQNDSNNLHQHFHRTIAKRLKKKKCWKRSSPNLSTLKEKWSWILI